MSAPASPGLRDRKKVQTREALRAAALQLAVQHGYEHVTVEAIVRAADVSARTFFNYFSSKDEALLAPDADLAAEIAEALGSRPPHEVLVDALRAVTVQFADTLGDKRSTWQLRLEVVRANPHLWPRLFAGFTAVERTLTQAVATRTGVDPDLDIYPGVVAAAFVGAVRVALAHWRSEDSASLQTLLTDAIDVLAAGLAGRRVVPTASSPGSSAP